MEFEWNEAKNDRNQKARSLVFGYAALIFSGAVIEKIDDWQDYGEVRIQAVGQVGADILAVVYTDRGKVRRIISVRRANRKERRKWRSAE